MKRFTCQTSPICTLPLAPPPPSPEEWKDNNLKSVFRYCISSSVKERPSGPVTIPVGKRRREWQKMKPAVFNFFAKVQSTIKQGRNVEGRDKQTERKQKMVSLFGCACLSQASADGSVSPWDSGSAQLSSASCFQSSVSFVHYMSFVCLSHSSWNWTTIRTHQTTKRFSVRFYVRSYSLTLQRSPLPFKRFVCIGSNDANRRDFIINHANLVCPLAAFLCFFHPLHFVSTMATKNVDDNVQGRAMSPWTICYVKAVAVERAHTQASIHRT